MYKMWLESVKAAQDSSFQLGQSPISRHNFNQELAINNEENWAKNGRKAKLNWGEQGNLFVIYSISTMTKSKKKYVTAIEYIILYIHKYISKIKTNGWVHLELEQNNFKATMASQITENWHVIWIIELAENLSPHSRQRKLFLGVNLGCPVIVKRI